LTALSTLVAASTAGRLHLSAASTAAAGLNARRASTAAAGLDTSRTATTTGSIDLATATAARLSGGALRSAENRRVAGTWSGTVFLLTISA
jgi:hypothetical protein